MSRYVLHDGLRIMHVLPAGTTAAEAEDGRLGWLVAALPAEPAQGWDAAPGWVWVDDAWQAPVVEAGPRLIWATEFAARFTDAEYGAIKAARATNASVDRMWDMLFDPRQQRVDLDFPPLVQGLALLEGAGLIGQGRAAEIRA